MQIQHFSARVWEIQGKESVKAPSGTAFTVTEVTRDLLLDRFEGREVAERICVSICWKKVYDNPGHSSQEIIEHKHQNNMFDFLFLFGYFVLLPYTWVNPEVGTFNPDLS